MKSIRPMPQRAFHAPRRSPSISSDDIRATRPAPVCNHPRKPGTFSSISPPPADVGGPQQGGLSRPSGLPFDVSPHPEGIASLSVFVAILISLIFMASPTSHLVATCKIILLNSIATTGLSHRLVQ